MAPEKKKTWVGGHNPQRVTSMYSSHGVFTDQFWREFRISFKSHNLVSKTYRPKNDIFAFWWRLVFLFDISYTRNALINGNGAERSGGEKLWSKMYLKINQSLKTLLHACRPSIGGTHQLLVRAWTYAPALLVRCSHHLIYQANWELVIIWIRYITVQDYCD